MGVQFDSGPFSATGGGYPTKLTEFTLDRTVDIVVGLQVDENDGSFLLYLIQPQSDGSTTLVQGSAPIDVSGVSIEVTFSAVPAGYYQVVVMTLGGTTSVVGTFAARWENIPEGGGDAEQSPPIRLHEEPQFREAEAIPQDPRAPVVEWVEVNSIAAESN